MFPPGAIVTGTAGCRTAVARLIGVLLAAAPSMPASSPLAPPLLPHHLESDVGVGIDVTFVAAIRVGGRHLRQALRLGLAPRLRERRRGGDGGRRRQDANRSHGAPRCAWHPPCQLRADTSGEPRRMLLTCGKRPRRPSRAR